MPTARDGYEAYFAEKLWQWLPAVYRELDALQGEDALRALVEAIADRAAVAKRDQDRLWDDAYVELADDWAVPYLGELVATRLVSALDKRARRIDVAKTIYYRRRKGTLSMLEQLIADIGAWHGNVVEEFRRLARLRHGLDGAARRGWVSGTPEGGLADIRAVRGGLLTGGPFEEYHYTPDMRRPQGRSGQRGIGKLSFHLYRLNSVGFSGVMPRRMVNLPGQWDGWTFDPSGRDVPLFARSEGRADWGGWRSPREWELPAAIGCRLLGEAVFEIGAAEMTWLKSAAPIASQAQRRAAVADAAKLQGHRIPSQAALLRLLQAQSAAAVLTQPAVLKGLIAMARIDACGSAALLPLNNGLTADGRNPAIAVSDSAGIIGREQTLAARLDGFQPPAPTPVRLYVEPERGRFAFDLHGHALASVRVQYQIGQAGSLGAGGFQRELASNDPAPGIWQSGNSGTGIGQNGETLIIDSATYFDPPDQTAVRSSRLMAQEAQRPYLVLRNSHWRLTSDGQDRNLTLDGLWVGCNQPHRIIIDGDFDQVTLRYCTLDPGGLDATGAVLPPIVLEVRGDINRLRVERCILAAIRLAGNHAAIDLIELNDSVVDSTAGVAIDAPGAWLVARRSTVIAPAIDQSAIDVERLDASELLVAGLVDVTDTQHGCFRFSARGAGSRVSKPYESHVLDEMSRLFTSRRFGDPHYATLSPVAPTTLHGGAENGGEIGAFNSLLTPIRQASLSKKIEEFLPFGRLPNFIPEN